MEPGERFAARVGQQVQAVEHVGTAARRLQVGATRLPEPGRGRPHAISEEFTRTGERPRRGPSTPVVRRAVPPRPPRGATERPGGPAHPTHSAPHWTRGAWPPCRRALGGGPVWRRRSRRRSRRRDLTTSGGQLPSGSRQFRARRDSAGRAPRDTWPGRCAAWRAGECAAGRVRADGFLDVIGSKGLRRQRHPGRRTRRPRPGVLLPRRVGDAVAPVEAVSRARPLRATGAPPRRGSRRRSRAARVPSALPAARPRRASALSPPTSRRRRLGAARRPPCARFSRPWCSRPGPPPRSARGRR